MNNKKTALIILSQVLEMPLERYLTYIDKKTNTVPATIEHRPQFTKSKRMSYAKVYVKNGELKFSVTDPRLVHMIPIDRQEFNDDNRIVALKWINTRNALSGHILKSLINYQRSFWHSGKEADLLPLTLRQFLLLYPFKHLDQSRLSRLLPKLRVEMPNGKVITLRKLFPSKKRCHAYRIEALINQHDTPLKDREIQTALAHQGIHLSLRTICNCRKLLNIPNFKQRQSDYYGKNLRFSHYVKLSRGQVNRIPCEAGVYELSVSEKVQYAKHSSNVLYIGCSKNLRKRMLTYSGSVKNHRLRAYMNGSTLYVRFFLTEHFTRIENELLKQFKRTYGELPKANIIGG